MPSMATAPSSDDRLLDVTSLPREVPVGGVTDADDMLDEDNNARAHQLGEMVSASTANHKQQLLQQMRQGAMPSLPQPVAPAGNTTWFTKKPLDIPIPAVVNAATTTPQPGAAMPSETLLTSELQQQHAIAETTSATENLKTIEPLHRPTARPAPATTPAPVAVTPPLDPATINLSTRDDLNITTIARMAKGQDKDTGSEVVISLHNHE